MQWDAGMASFISESVRAEHIRLHSTLDKIPRTSGSPQAKQVPGIGHPRPTSVRHGKMHSSPHRGDRGGCRPYRGIEDNVGSGTAAPGEAPGARSAPPRKHDVMFL